MKEVNIYFLNGLNMKKINIKYICIETHNFKNINKILTKNNYTFLEKLSKYDYLYKKK